MAVKLEGWQVRRIKALQAELKKHQAEVRALMDTLDKADLLLIYITNDLASLVELVDTAVEGERNDSAA